MNEIYETSDIHQACYLKCSGFDMIGTTKDKSKIFFMFEDSQELKDSLLSYYNRKSRVEPINYKVELETLKTIVKK